MAEPGRITRKYSSVQVLRFVAALLVVGTHATLYTHDRLDKHLAVWHFGEMGVDIFFVISGLVMVVSTTRLRGQVSGWKYFAMRRAVRIIPIYWIATTVKLLTFVASPGSVLHAQVSARTVILSYLFLPSTNRDGQVEPLLSVGWTLTYEMMFYAVFALALYLRKSPLVFCGAVLTALAVASIFRTSGWPAALVYLHPRVLYFLAGMVIGQWAVTGSRRVLVLGLSYTLGLYAVVEASAAARTGVFSMWDNAGRHVVAIGVVLLAVGANAALDRVLPPLAAYLGDASYSLYLFHPLVAPVAPAGLHHLGIRSVPLSIVLCLVVAVVASIVIYTYLERPLTDWLQRHLPYVRQRPTVATDVAP